jgi:hypothetical protein
MKKGAKIAIAVVLIVIVGLAGFFAYEFYLQPIAGNSCEPYLKTNCGGNDNAITYNTSNGDITIPSVSQSYGSTYYNVAVAYVPGNSNFEPTGAFFQADTSDIPGNTLNSGQTVTLHDINATGPATAGQMYNGSLWVAYTSTSGGQVCAGAYNTASGCQYTQIGTITLKG